MFFPQREIHMPNKRQSDSFTLEAVGLHVVLTVQLFGNEYTMLREVGEN
jgi:hypothetical protein